MRQVIVALLSAALMQGIEAQTLRANPVAVWNNATTKLGCSNITWSSTEEKTELFVSVNNGQDKLVRTTSLNKKTNKNEGWVRPCWIHVNANYTFKLYSVPAYGSKKLLKSQMVFGAGPELKANTQAVWTNATTNLGCVKLNWISPVADTQILLSVNGKPATKWRQTKANAYGVNKGFAETCSIRANSSYIFSLVRSSNTSQVLRRITVWGAGPLLVATPPVVWTNTTTNKGCIRLDWITPLNQTELYVSKDGGKDVLLRRTNWNSLRVNRGSIPQYCNVETASRYIFKLMRPLNGKLNLVRQINVFGAGLKANATTVSVTNPTKKGCVKLDWASSVSATATIFYSENGGKDIELARSAFHPTLKVARGSKDACVIKAGGRYVFKLTVPGTGAYAVPRVLRQVVVKGTGPSASSSVRPSSTGGVKPTNTGSVKPTGTSKPTSTPSKPSSTPAKPTTTPCK